MSASTMEVGHHTFMCQQTCKQCLTMSFSHMFACVCVGASFLIPYLVMLLVVGLPAMLIELSAGQYARVGANKVFGRMVPAFKVTTKYNSFNL